MVPLECCLFVCLKFYYLWSKVNVSGMKNSCAKTTGMDTKTHTRYYSFFVCFFSVYCGIVIQDE